MINEIKAIVQNYLNNAKLCNVMTGIVESNGIRISEKIVIPNELMKGNLMDHISIGDKVRLIRNHGGKEFYIIEIIDKQILIRGSTITLSRDGNSYEYKVEDVVK